MKHFYLRKFIRKDIENNKLEGIDCTKYYKEWYNCISENKRNKECKKIKIEYLKCLNKKNY